jgi:DNA polymerase III subunit delta
MTLVKASELAGLFASGKSPPVVVLIHGADRSAVYDLGKQLVRKVTGVVDEALGSVRLAEQQVTGSHERLYEEFASVSLFGDKQVVWVSDAGDAIAKVLEPILQSETSGNLILIDAEGLPKTSKLRKLCEGSSSCVSVALYEESPQELRGRLQRQIRAAALEITEEAMQRLLELVSFERAVGESETQKLTLYCHGSATIEVEDVDAICGDTSEASSDDLVDAVFGGNLNEADRFSSTVVGNRNGLSLVLQHVTKLQAMALQATHGQSIDTVVNSPRFGIFFKRRSAVSSQLKLWNVESLMAAETRICNAVLQTRQYPDLDDAIVNRTLLALSRSARLR